MIQIKTNTTIDRDPSVYLGIDGTVIPFDLFKGVYFEDGLLFTDDPFYGVQFIVSRRDPHNPNDVREEGVSLVTLEPDMHVTLEDVQSTDKWMKIGHALVEYSTMICGVDVDNFSIENKKAKKRILEKYYAGQTGLLSESSKVYDEEGLYYMWNFQEFNTKIEGESLLDRVHRHIQFVQYAEDSRDVWSRTRDQLEMHTKKKVFQEYAKSIIGYGIPISYFQHSDETDGVEDIFFTSVYEPVAGCNVNFVPSKRNDFIIKLRKN